MNTRRIIEHVEISVFTNITSAMEHVFQDSLLAEDMSALKVQTSLTTFFVERNVFTTLRLIKTTGEYVVIPVFHGNMNSNHFYPSK